jgi:RsiW-degrading membrane proteinase PrsW (M82 family)
MAFVTSALALAVIVAPVVEEVAKFLVVKWTAYGRKEFDEPVDGMVYAAAAQGPCSSSWPPCWAQW